MAYNELVKVGNTYNVPIHTYVCDSTTALSDITDAPIGSIAQIIAADGSQAEYIYILKNNLASWVEK